MPEQTLPQYFRNPETRALETVARDMETLDAVIDEFYAQPSGQRYLEIYDSSENLKTLVRTVEGRGHLVTFSSLGRAFRALEKLNDPNFRPVAETEEAEKQLQLETNRALFGEFERFFSNCTSAQHRARAGSDTEYRKYTDKRLESLKDLPANPQLIPSELFAGSPAPATTKQPTLKLTDEGRQELEEFSLLFRNMTAQEARAASMVSISGSAAHTFNEMAEKAKAAGILKSYSNF